MIKLLPLGEEVETKKVLKKAALAHKALAELKGIITSIPNENILKLFSVLSKVNFRASFRPKGEISE